MTASGGVGGATGGGEPPGPVEPPVTVREERAARGELVVAGLSWRPYGRREPTLADIGLRIRPGERVLLLGASGSGKSTLLQAMAGLLDDSLGEAAGTVTVDGVAPTAEPGAVGLLLQDPTHALVAEYAGRDAAFGPENRSRPRREILSTAEHALDEVGFPYGADHSSFALSGGESSRLALAGAVALTPRVLLLDEPTAMLDPAAAATSAAAIQASALARGLTVVVVEHRLEHWASWCDRVVVLDRGRLLADGPSEAVLNAQREQLLDAGLWLPGAEPPTPADFGDLYRPGRPTAGLRLAGVQVTGATSTPLLQHPVDLELGAGAGTALTGPSGVGKSTLLRAVGGLDTPAAGSVSVRTPAGWRAPHELTRAVELAAIFGWLAQHTEATLVRGSVRAEVLATSEALFADDPEHLQHARRRAEMLLDALGLTPLADADPHRLSGGEQRRLALAAALAHGPGVLLLDEPTVGQDRLTWAAITGLVRTARRAGTIVVTSTHDQVFAATLDQTVALEPEQDRRPGTAVEHRVGAVYEPGAPPAARCNPLALLFAAVAAAVGSFWVDSAWAGLATVGWSVLLAPLAVRRVTSTLRRLIPVGLAALSVGWSTLLFSRYGVFAPAAFPVAGREITRILCLVVPGALLAGLIRPSGLGDALAQRLHLPHRPVIAATAALLRLDLIFATWTTLGDVRRIRGLGPGRSPTRRARHLLSMTVALLVGVLRSSAQMALSMDARGFAAAHRRTFALPSVWAGRDWVCCAIGVWLAAFPIGLTRLT